MAVFVRIGQKSQKWVNSEKYVTDLVFFELFMVTNFRYVRVISPDVPSKTVASLHKVGQGCRVSYADRVLDPRQQIQCQCYQQRRVSVQWSLHRCSFQTGLFCLSLNSPESSDHEEQPDFET